MKLLKGIFAAAIVLISCGIAAAPQTVEQLSQADRENIQKVALELRDAILHNDLEGILRHVNQSAGLTCTDTVVPYEQVKNDLYNKNSYLYMSLFNTNKYAKKCGKEYPTEFPAISDKEFFSTEKHQSIELVPYPHGYVEVIFKSQIKNHYKREWEFKKEGREWKLIDGLIVGNCSCG